MNFNQNINPKKDHLTRLELETQKICMDFNQALNEICDEPTQNSLLDIQCKFISMSKSWKTLSSTLESNLCTLIQYSNKLSEDSKSNKAMSLKKIHNQKLAMKSKENNIKVLESNASQSLINIKQMWDSSLNIMKNTLKNQKIRKNQIVEILSNVNKENYDGVNDIFVLPAADKHNKSIDKESLSHGSAFSYLTDMPELKIQLGISDINEHSRHPSNYSAEFDKYMSEIESQRPPIENQVNFSIDKSLGGWKSEYESEGENESFINQVNPIEIKSAIKVLKKANLLGSKSGNLLEKLSNLLKSPENTNKIELLLQLIQLENKSKLQNAHKPPLVTPKQKRLQETDLELTPKAVFIQSEDLELNKTILSSENPLSARNQEEIFDHILDELNNSTQDLRDVKLEDLLKISYFIPEMKLDINTHDQIEQDSREPKDYLRCLSILSPLEAKLPSPVKKQSNAVFDSQSTGISSNSGLRSRITLKTAGSESSQKVFTPGSKGIEESFNLFSLKITKD
jgi:hypothetical protein